MAVQEILGTDSLSSSRITINDNFLSLEDEIGDIKAFLSPTAATLNNVTINTSEIIVGNSTSNTAAISLSGATFNTSVEFNNNITVQGSTVYSGVSGSAATPLTDDIGASALINSTYFVDPTNIVNIESTAIDGLEITIIATSPGEITGSIAGHNDSIVFNNIYESVTLRSFDQVWYVIAKCISADDDISYGGTGGTGGN